MSRLGLRLTPHGRLSVEDQDDGPHIDAAASIRLIDAFARGTGYGLVWLGAAEVGQALPPLFVWWRDFAALYVGSLCLHASGMEAEERQKLPSVPAPTASELSSLVLTTPIMPGAEYLTQDVLLALWDEMERAFAASLAAAKVGLQAFLTTLNRAWNLVGRVHFNLAENRRDPDRPFAFMATYTTRLSAQAKARHVPLGQALREYAGATNRDKLLSLLLPVQRAAEHCAWLKPMIDAGDIFHPLRWGPTEASRFLQSVPELESAGVVVRMPVSWRASRPSRPQVTATVGRRAPWRGCSISRWASCWTASHSPRSRLRPCSPVPRTSCCCVVNGSRSIGRGFNARWNSSAQPRNSRPATASPSRRRCG